MVTFVPLASTLPPTGHELIMYTGSSTTVITSVALALLLLAPPSAHAQASGQDGVLTQKEANQVRRLLAKGKTKQAFKVLGDGRWCRPQLVEGWDPQKNMAFAADLGVHARRAKKLEQAAHCTLSAIPRKGSRHNGAALFELSLLAKSMGPEALLELLPAHAWADGLEEYVTCSEESEEDRWARTPADAVYCALVLGQRAKKGTGGRLARDRLVLNAAQFAPRLAYLRRLSKKDRTRLVRFVLRGHREVSTAANSEKAMWASFKARSSPRGVPYCSSLGEEARDAMDESDVCTHFEKGKVLNKAKAPGEMALVTFEQGVNEVGSPGAGLDGDVYMVAMRVAPTGVHHTAPFDLNLEHGDPEVVFVRDGGRTIMVRSETDTRLAPSTIYMTMTEVTCHYEGEGQMHCLEGTWNETIEQEYDDFEHSDRTFPRYTIKDGRIRVASAASGDFYFKEYRALDGLTVKQAIEALPKIEERITKRYVDLEVE